MEERHSLDMLLTARDREYSGGVLGPNGKIYLVPNNANHVGELDPATRTFSAIDISATISCRCKYRGGVLGPKGKIYLVPGNADHVGELDPATRTLSAIDISATIWIGKSPGNRREKRDNKKTFQQILHHVPIGYVFWFRSGTKLSVRGG